MPGDGAVAQLGERQNRTLEAVSSILISSTAESLTFWEEGGACSIVGELHHDVRVPGFRLSSGLLGSFLFGE